jgi:signal transduction histidine kinase
VKHAAEAHGGSVVAEAAPDGGTIITLRLPTAEAIGAVSDLVEL